MKSGDRVQVIADGRLGTVRWIEDTLAGYVLSVGFDDGESALLFTYQVRRERGE